MHRAADEKRRPKKCLTDGIDGYLARKRGQITTMGILLDPLADKLLIAAAFITLVQLSPSLVPAWIAVIVIGREFLVTGLRSIAASEGFTVEASELGKFKMVVQIVSVVAAIVDHHWAHLPWYFLYLPVHPIALASIWIMVALSLGLGYFYWDAALDAVRRWLESGDLVKGLWGWLQTVGGAHLDRRRLARLGTGLRAAAAGQA